MLIRKPGTKSAECYVTYEEFKNLPLDGIEDCSIAYIKDWYRLNSSARDELGGKKVQMFDVKEQIWMPQ